MYATLLALCLCSPALADKSDCRCGDCQCRDGRVAACCICPRGACRCADVVPPAVCFYVADIAVYACLAHLQNTPLQGSERQVVLSDAHRFGLDYYSVRANWYLAKDHASRMRDVVKVNDPNNLASWELEVAWRHRAHYLLDDVLNCPGMSVGAKLNSLDELRRLIGQDAYDRGIMPSPFPTYRGLTK